MHSLLASLFMTHVFIISAEISLAATSVLPVISPSLRLFLLFPLSPFIISPSPPLSHSSSFSQVGAWTGANGRALPLPPHLPPVLAKATEGLRHRTTTGGGGVSSSSSSGDSAGNDEGAGGEDESSRDRKEDRVSNQELQTTSPGRAIVKASSSPSTVKDVRFSLSAPIDSR